MDKERLIEIIREPRLTEAHLGELERLVEQYPWFPLPRFLRLKAIDQVGQEPEAAELSRTVVFSSDRKHLYKWVKGTYGSLIETGGLSTTELEFLDSEEEGEGAEGEGEDSFFLLDEDGEEEENDDADARPIPEKDDTEMEEPELEDPEAVPVIDPLDDEDDEELDDVEGDPDAIDDPDTGEDHDTHAEVLVGNAMLNGDDLDDIDEMDDGEELDAPDSRDSGDVLNTEDDKVSEALLNAGEEIPGDEQRPDSEELPVGAPGSPTKGENSNENETSQPAYNPSADLIERFLKSEPGVIKADQQTNLEGDVSEGSVQEDDSFITDTLAKIYVKQGLHAKAIYAYERLSLKYPEKSAYFAAQIEKIKNNANV